MRINPVLPLGKTNQYGKKCHRGGADLPVGRQGRRIFLVMASRTWRCVENDSEWMTDWKSAVIWPGIANPGERGMPFGSAALRSGDTVLWVLLWGVEDDSGWMADWKSAVIWPGIANPGERGYRAGVPTGRESQA
jgi:hypothetical protein